jgi:hypothetical protein
VACCGGALTLTGRGRIIQQGCVYTLEHLTGDRRVMAKVDFAVRRGNGSVQSPPGTTRCVISDSNIRNNSCQCSVLTPGGIK